VRALLAVGRRADGGAAVEGAPRAVGGVFAAGSVRVSGAATCRLAGAPVEATLVTLTAPLQGPTPDGVRASTVVVLLSPSATAASPPASRTWRGLRLDAALAGVRRPVVAIERVAELEQIR
jgi:hypothetical protein